MYVVLAGHLIKNENKLSIVVTLKYQNYLTILSTTCQISRLYFVDLDFGSTHLHANKC